MAEPRDVTVAEPRKLDLLSLVVGLLALLGSGLYALDAHGSDVDGEVVAAVALLAVAALALVRSAVTLVRRARG